MSALLGIGICTSGHDKVPVFSLTVECPVLAKLRSLLERIHEYRGRGFPRAIQVTLADSPSTTSTVDGILSSNVGAVCTCKTTSNKNILSNIGFSFPNSGDPAWSKMESEHFYTETTWWANIWSSQYLFWYKDLKKDHDSDTSFAIPSTFLEQAVCMYITPTSVQAKSVQSVLIR